MPRIISLLERTSMDGKEIPTIALPKHHRNRDLSIDVYWRSDITNSTNMPSIQESIYFTNIHLRIVQICGIFWVYFGYILGYSTVDLYLPPCQHWSQATQILWRWRWWRWWRWRWHWWRRRLNCVPTGGGGRGGRRGRRQG